jgi:CzcA family heavy metal efflux pump
MSPIRFSVRNPVFANLMMVALTILGVMAFFDLPREQMPKIPFNWVFITTAYPNVPAEDVEQLITVPIENEISGLDGVEEISSISFEGASFVQVKFELAGKNQFDKWMTELKTEVDKADLPEDAEDPDVEEFDTDDFVPVLSVTLSGDFPERTLHDLSEQLEDLYTNVDGVSRVALAGVRERRIWVNVTPEQLYAKELSLGQVSGAIALHNRNMAAGDLNVGAEKLLVRTVGELHTAEEFGHVVIRSGPQGRQVYLRDIAQIEDGWEEEASRARMNGQKAVTLSLSKKSKSSSLDVIAEVKRLTENFRSKLPQGMEITYTNDSSNIINDLLGDLSSNAWMGFILVIIPLYLLLDWRSALFTSLSIPITLAITMLFLKYTGSSLNGSSLFGLILVLGMVVDQATVVVDNSYRYIKAGLGSREAALKGALEVAWPVTTSVLTVVAAFVPLMLLPGIIGRFMRIVPIVVSLALAASLFQAFFILPAQIAVWSKPQKKVAAWKDRWGDKILSVYQNLLEVMIRRRKLIMLLMPFVIIASLAMIPLVGVELYRDEEISQFFVRVKMPQGTSLEATDQVIRRIEEEARKLPASELHAVVATPGVFQSDAEWLFTSSVGQVIVDLNERQERKLAIDSLINLLRSRTRDISGIQSIEFAKVNTGPPVGKAVEVKVQGKYFDDLEAVADELKAELRSTEGVYDVDDNYIPGKRQVKIKVDPAKAALYGLNVTQVATTAYSAFNGLKSTVLHDGDDEIDVMVRFPEGYMDDIQSVQELKIQSPQGVLVPFLNVASISVEAGPADIRRFEKERAITVSANVDKAKVSGVQINQKLINRFKNIGDRYPGVRLVFKGEFEEFAKAFSGLAQLFLIGAALMFLILAAEFHSLVQPLIIMIAIPFGFIGAVVGLILSGNPFSVTTLYGFVGLAGVVVNNSIVMIAFINDARAEGMEKHAAIINSGLLRLRPIFLTSINTITGVLPIAMGWGGYSEVWGPLANTFCWGLSVSTLLTLLIVPAIYKFVVDDMGGWFRRRFHLQASWEQQAI